MILLRWIAPTECSVTTDACETIQPDGRRSCGPPRAAERLLRRRRDRVTAKMKRRAFITLLGGTVIAWPLAARAQQVSTRRPLVAVLSAVTRERNLPLNAFVQGMREFDYVEGENIDNRISVCRRPARPISGTRG